MTIFLLFLFTFSVFAEFTNKYAFTELTDDTFHNATQGATVLVFYKPWSSVYKNMISSVNRLAEMVGDQVFVGMIDVQRNTKVAKSFVLPKLPYVLIKKIGNVVLQYDGDFEINRIMDVLYRENMYHDVEPVVTLISQNKEESEAVRMALAMLEVKYSEKIVNQEEWKKMKEELNEKKAIYAETPLLQYGDDSVQNQFAIMKYLARKAHLYGANDLEQIRLDEFIETSIVLTTNLKNQGKNYETQFNNYLHNAENLLEKSTNLHIITDSSNICDIVLYYVLHITIKPAVKTDTLKWYPKIEKFMIRMEAIPNLKKFISS